MSFESNFEERVRRARAAEDGASSDSDGSSRLDPVTSVPGQRPAPEGLIIHTDDLTEETFSDTSWQDEFSTSLEKNLCLFATLHGNPCGWISFDLKIRKNPDDGQTILDKYVFLGTVEVTGQQRQGIGSSLLEQMETRARRFGASRIEGDITKLSLVETPTLPSFYRHRGYDVTPQGKGFKIVKPL